MNNIRTNIQDLNKQKPAPFSDDVIYNYGTYLRENNIYLKDDVKYYVDSIPIDNIVGIDQMYGDDSTWGQCLEGRWLKRLDRNLVDLEINPQYYLSENELSSLSFIKVEDKYFIRAGKHRTIIARFLAYFNPEVFSERSPFQFAKVAEYHVDTEYVYLKRRFEALAVKYAGLTFELQHTTRTSDRSFLIVKEKGHRVKLETFSRDQAYQVLEALENPSMKAKWNSVKEPYNSNIYSFIPYQACFKALFGKW